MYSYIKPFIVIKRHTLIHNATDLQTVPWLEQTESATPARKAHAHAQALTQTHMQAHMPVHNYASGVLLPPHCGDIPPLRAPRPPEHAPRKILIGGPPLGKKSSPPRRPPAPAKTLMPGIKRSQMAAPTRLGDPPTQPRTRV